MIRHYFYKSLFVFLLLVFLLQSTPECKAKAPSLESLKKTAAYQKQKFEGRRSLRAYAQLQILGKKKAPSFEAVFLVDFPRRKMRIDFLDDMGSLFFQFRSDGHRAWVWNPEILEYREVKLDEEIFKDVFGLSLSPTLFMESLLGHLPTPSKKASYRIAKKDPSTLLWKDAKNKVWLPLDGNFPLLVKRLKIEISYRFQNKTLEGIVLKIRKPRAKIDIHFVKIEWNTTLKETLFTPPVIL